jgi:nucleotidyltransferase substrate binding protein (TIGR01987 family)
MKINDIRWEQRFSNFKKALSKLKEVIKTEKLETLSELEQEGLIQRFEYTHELAWNVMKDYFEYQGNSTITGSRDAIREAFNKKLITNGEMWMETIKSKNKTTHTYNEETAKTIVNDIVNNYYQLFIDFEIHMEKIQNDNKKDIFSAE